MKLEQVLALVRDEKTTLEERFIQACVLVDKLKKPLGLSQDDQLKFYGYFKQGAFGNCNKKKPSLFDVAKRELWKAWDDVKGMSKEEAQQAYIEFGLAALASIKEDKQSDVAKICADLNEETFKKVCMEKIQNNYTDPESGKPKLCIVEQAKELSKDEEVKIWSAVAEKIKASMSQSAAIVPSKVAASYGAGVVSATPATPVKPITFSDLGNAVASAIAGPGMVVIQKVSIHGDGYSKIKNGV